MGDRLFPFEVELPLDGITGEVVVQCETDDPAAAPRATARPSTPRRSRCSSAEQAQAQRDVRGEQRGDGDDTGGGRAQHLGAEAYDVGAGVLSAASSSGLMPPSGPTTTTIRPASGRPARRAAAVASSWSTSARSASATRAASSAVEASGVTVGSHERRDCLAGLAGGGLPLRVGLRRALALPDRHRAGRGPRHDAVDADLGEHLDGELAAVALGQRLHDGDRRLRARLAARRTRP